MIQPGANVYTQGFGSRPENVEVPHLDVRAPSTTDILYPVGKRWINTVANTVYELTSQTSGVNGTTSVWTFLGAGAGDLNTLTTQDTTIVTPSAGNINLSGTTNQLTTSGSGHTATISLASTLVAPGSVTATTTLTATLGNITATNGNIVRGTAGNKDIYTSVASTNAAGANSAGHVTLVNGTVTVATTAVTANSLIRLTRQGIGTTGANLLGYITLGTITPNVQFIINSVTPADATALETDDQSIVFWEIVN